MPLCLYVLLNTNIHAAIIYPREEILKFTHDDVNCFWIRGSYLLVA